MNNLTFKQKIMIVIGIIGAILILIFQRGLYSTPTASVEKLPQIQTETDKIELVSTNPSPLEEAILWAMQPIELTFNTPLVNAPEFKHRIEPKPEYRVELSDDKKTVRIIPTKPLQLGLSFTLSVQSDAKFDGNKTLGRDYTFHFRTIEYKGV